MKVNKDNVQKHCNKNEGSLQDNMMFIFLKRVSKDPLVYHVRHGTGSTLKNIIYLSHHQFKYKSYSLVKGHQCRLETPSHSICRKRMWELDIYNKTLVFCFCFFEILEPEQ